jgi:hypothetical protein
VFVHAMADRADCNDRPAPDAIAVPDRTRLINPPPPGHRTPQRTAAGRPPRAAQSIAALPSTSEDVEKPIPKTFDLAAWNRQKPFHRAPVTAFPAHGILITRPFRLHEVQTGGFPPSAGLGETTS